MIGFCGLDADQSALPLAIVSYAPVFPEGFPSPILLSLGLLSPSFAHNPDQTALSLSPSPFTSLPTVWM